jgi:hypothetical protein
MERKMTTFAREISGCDIDLLYTIICKKYKNFIQFYRLVEDMAENIDSLKYEFSSDSSLYVSMTMKKGTDIKDTVSKLESKIDSTGLYTYNIMSEGKKVKIEVNKK